jgi:uncharacterized membrane protein
MNVTKKTRTLAIAGILTAITFLLGLTPLGYIPINPALKITILCIPVLIGVLLEGLGVGIWLGFIFGLTSLLQIFMGDVLGLIFIQMSVLKTIAVVFIPRLLVPVTAYYVYKLIKLIGNKITDKVGYAIAAFVGSATNTALFIGFVFLFFGKNFDDIGSQISISAEALKGTLTSAIIINGIPEAIAAVIIVTAVCIAVSVFREKQIKK